MGLKGRLLILALAIILVSCNSPTPTIAETQTATLTPAKPSPTRIRATATIEPTTRPSNTETVTPTDLAQSSEGADWNSMIGVNLAGAEFGEDMPGSVGKSHIYPGCDDIQRWTKKGVKLFRYPIRIERLVDGDKLRPEFTQLTDMLICAAKNDAMVIIDAHNYGRVKVNGSEMIISAEKLAGFWKIVSHELTHYPAVVAYGLMNEPHDLGEVSWKQLAQAGIDAIREVDSKKTILVGGDCWGGAHSWRGCNQELNQLQDPMNNLVFEAHQYFDTDSSGQYTCGSALECNMDKDKAILRLKPFVEWCTTNQLKCFVGEIGVPYADDSWKSTLSAAIDYLEQNKVGAAFWSAGPWWGNYQMSLEQSNASWIQNTYIERR